MGVKERKAIEKQVRRNQILSAARALLFSTGMENISISKISKKAELGVGTIYFYFKNKEEIFVELQKEGLALLYTHLLNISKKALTQEEKLDQIAQAYYRFSEEQLQYFDIINYFLSSPRIYFEASLKTQIDMSGHKIVLLIQDIVSSGVKEGVFNEPEPVKFSIMFWGTLHGMIHFKKLEQTVLENEKHTHLFNYSVQKLIHGIKS